MKDSIDIGDSEECISCSVWDYMDGGDFSDFFYGNGGEGHPVFADSEDE